ncbi:DHA2 family efflux MFS transporter permease subunit [Paenibacillus sp. GCM10023252]|uniref:DHA2 family efflux MFS transporter permease subunit n=1 Tax=Paenibacillus sp. GCM10023252 TaxID=3252649 RepID=UPI003617F5EB
MMHGEAAIVASGTQSDRLSAYWKQLATLFLGSFIGIYHVVSLNVALPGFIRIFDTELATVQWLVTGFTLATGIIAPLSGFLGDRWSNKNLFLVSIAGLTVTSLLCALSWNVYVLILFRMLQGLFCGLIQPVALTMIYQSVPREQQSTAISLWSGATILGPALAPTISGWLQGYNWHWMFVVTLPLSILTYAMGVRYLPSHRSNTLRKADGLGMFLAVLGSLCLLYLFGRVHAWGWLDRKSLILLGTGVTAIALFIRHQLRTDTPLLQLRLFRSRMFTASLASSVVLIIGLYSGIYFIPLYLQEIHQMSSLQVGLLLIPPAMALAGATLLSGKLYRWIGPMPLVGTGALLLAGASWAFTRLTPDTSSAYVALWMSVRYVGIGLSMTPAMNAGMGAVSKEQAGDASALINWLRQVFGALALGMFTSLFYARYAYHEQHPIAADAGLPSIHASAYTMGVNDAFFVAFWIIASALPLALLLHRKR